jgi:hypothetical protein
MEETNLHIWRAASRIQNEHMHTANIGGPAAWKFNKRLITPHHTKTNHTTECYTGPQTFLYMGG